jgi:Helix-turn-helix domain
MTRALADGTLLIDPADTLALAPLLREGVRQVAGRRRLTPAEAEVTSTVELAAYSARRSVAGPATVPAPTGPTPLWATVTEASGALGVSERHVRRLCRGGRLAAERRGPVWTIDPDSLAGYALSKASA